VGCGFVAAIVVAQTYASLTSVIAHTRRWSQRRHLVYSSDTEVWLNTGQGALLVRLERSARWSSISGGRSLGRPRCLAGRQPRRTNEIVLLSTSDGACGFPRLTSHTGGRPLMMLRRTPLVRGQLGGWICPRQHSSSLAAVVNARRQLRRAGARQVQARYRAPSPARRGPGFTSASTGGPDRRGVDDGDGTAISRETAAA
jgi:hypothetical protein